MRVERGLRQEQLAPAIGVSVSMLSRVEAGTRRLAASKLDASNQAEAVARLVEDWAGERLAGQREALRRAMNDFPGRGATIVASLPTEDQ